MESVLVPNGKEGPHQGWMPITDMETKEKVLLDYNEKKLQQVLVLVLVLVLVSV